MSFCRGDSVISKTSTRTQIVHGTFLENLKESMCERRLRLYSYVLHRSIVTIDTHCIALGFLRLLLETVGGACDSVVRYPKHLGGMFAAICYNSTS